jgi:hypothetical protein
MKPAAPVHAHDFQHSVPLTEAPTIQSLEFESTL